MMQYRADIDGLRAVAVAAVVAFHVDNVLVSGGYVGVDIFFVISGFLITCLILDELDQTGRLDFRNFFARRIKRLFPLLYLVILFTSLASPFFLTPLGQRQDAAQSAIATSLYMSNLYFWRATGEYFRESADLQPLLHTWSLAVEEQFYLAWPAVLVFAYWCARRYRASTSSVVAATVVGAFVTSLLVCIYATMEHQNAAFFLMPARAWEFATGASVAVLRQRISRASHTVSTAASIIGLGALLVSIVAFDSETQFPGAAALLPVVGAALVIAAGCGNQNSFICRMLGSRLFVRVGVLSYGWYLWHWPLLAMVRAHDLGHRALERDVAIACLALLLAAITHRLIEKPVRSGKIIGASSTAALQMSVILMFAGVGSGALGFAFAETESHREHYIGIPRPKVDSPAPSSSFCANDAWHSWGEVWKTCLKGLPESTGKGLILWGDSHAEPWIAALTEFEQRYAHPLIREMQYSCPAFVSARHARETCYLRNKGVVEKLGSAPEIRSYIGGIVVVMHYDLYTSSAHGVQRPRFSVGDRIVQLDELPQLLESELRQLTAAAGEAGLRVLFIAPVPEYPFSVPECVARRPGVSCRVPTELVDVQRQLVLETLTRLKDEFHNVEIWDPAKRLCDEAWCSPILDSSIIYRDGNHLTSEGGHMLLDGLLDHLQWAVSDR